MTDTPNNPVYVHGGTADDSYVPFGGAELSIARVKRWFSYDFAGSPPEQAADETETYTLRVCGCGFERRFAYVPQGVALADDEVEGIWERLRD